MLAHPKLLKLARLALDVSQDELSASASISRRTLQKLESCDRDTTVRTIHAVQRALEDRGVVFLGETEVLGSGFRLPVGHLQQTWDESSDTDKQEQERRR